MMKTIGLIGGMSWESSIEYYRIVNEYTRERLGGFHSAECVMWSVDFADIEAMQMSGRWDDAAARLIDAAQRLERAGAECLILCTNTMHRLIDQIAPAVAIPFIHIADPTAERIRADGFTTVGLLGTRFTMEGDFYSGRLETAHGLHILTPDDAGRTAVHDIIYHELVLGMVNPQSRQVYKDVIARLVDDGAQGIILGCTEIMLLVQPEDSLVPVYDTTRLHARAAVDWALNS